MAGKKIKNPIVLIVIVLVAAFVTEFMLGLNYRTLQAVAQKYNESRVVTLAELEALSCHLEDNRMISDGDDPQLVLSDVGTIVGCIAIKYSESAFDSMKVEVFYTSEEGEFFTQDKSESSFARKDRGCVLIPLGEYVKDLRIDIGESIDSNIVIDKIYINPSFAYYLGSVVRNYNIIRLIIFITIYALILFAIRDFAFFKRFVYKYRWLLGAAFVLFCVIFKLHGSSLGVLVNHLGADNTELIFGKSRSIRSDEFVAFTEMALSQVKSGFRWFSDIWGYSPSDMFIIYGQPVANIMTIFRPFSAAYLFLGAERGLAFYWASRMAVGFLVSFEFGRILTRDNRKLSFGYALLVILSPVVQWWYSTNELVEMLIVGQLEVLIICRYIQEKSFVKKILLSIAFAYGAGIYGLAFYPAWMVPLFYVFLSIAVAVIIENRKAIKVKGTDILSWLIAAVLLSGCLIYIYLRSGDTISKILHTAYPGVRAYEGGPFSNVLNLFRGWTSYLWSFTEADNPCARACFISFFPVGTIISAIVIFRKKIRDKMLICLNILNIILIGYAIIPLPGLIGKITLLNKSLDTRIILAIGFLNLVIFFRAFMYVCDGKIKVPVLLIVISALASGVVSVISAADQIKWYHMVGVIAVVAICGVVIPNAGKKRYANIFVIICAALAFIGGCIVNPVSSGLKSLYDNPILKAVERVNNDEGLWIFDGSLEFSNVPTIVGADTASALDTYPDEELWTQIGLIDEENSWNRYLHKTVLVDRETRIELVQDDLANIYLTTDNLRDLGVRYILSMRNLDEYGDLNRLYKYGNYSIYELSH